MGKGWSEGGVVVRTPVAVCAVDVFLLRRMGLEAIAGELVGVAWHALAPLSAVEIGFVWPSGLDDAFPVHYPALRVDLSASQVVVLACASIDDLGKLRAGPGDRDAGRPRGLSNVALRLSWSHVDDDNDVSSPAVPVPSLTALVPSFVDDTAAAMACPPSPADLSWLAGVVAALGPFSHRLLRESSEAAGAVAMELDVSVPVDDSGVRMGACRVRVSCKTQRSSRGGAEGPLSPAGPRSVRAHGFLAGPPVLAGAGDKDPPSSPVPTCGGTTPGAVPLLCCRWCGGAVGLAGSARFDCACGGVVYCCPRCRSEHAAVGHDAQECQGMRDCVAAAQVLYNVAAFPFLADCTLGVHAAVGQAASAAYVCGLLSAWGVHRVGPWRRVCPCDNAVPLGAFVVSTRALGVPAVTASLTAPGRTSGGKRAGNPTSGAGGGSGAGTGAGPGRGPRVPVAAPEGPLRACLDPRLVASPQLQLLATLSGAPGAVNPLLTFRMLHGWEAVHRALRVDLSVPEALVLHNAATLYYVIRLLSSTNQVSVQPAGVGPGPALSSLVPGEDGDEEPSGPASTRDALVVDYLNPGGEVDFPAQMRLLQALLPGVTIHVRMVGPRVPVELDGWAVVWPAPAAVAVAAVAGVGGGRGRGRGRLVGASSDPTNVALVATDSSVPTVGLISSLPALRPGDCQVSYLAGDYAGLLGSALAADGTVPDAIVALNASLGQSDVWGDLLPSIAVFVGEGIPFFVTEPDLWAAAKAESVMAVAGCPKPFPITLNPFRSPLSSVGVTQAVGLTVPCLPNAFLVGCGVDDRPDEGMGGLVEEGGPGPYTTEANVSDSEDAGELSGVGDGDGDGDSEYRSDGDGGGDSAGDGDGDGDGYSDADSGGDYGGGDISVAKS